MSAPTDGAPLGYYEGVGRSGFKEGVGVKSTMQDGPLLVSSMLQHAKNVNSLSEVVTITQTGSIRASFGDCVERAERLACALERLGVRRGDRVATFMWNNQRHLEAYMAVPSMGAVLHTLNFRLFPEQLAYVINHAEDKVIIVDDVLVPLLARILPELRTVEAIVVAGDGDASGLGTTHSYDGMIAAESAGYEWPLLDEHDAASMCYTSGTTGNPKGVVYSHRSIFLHSLGVISGSCIGCTHADRILVIVPMFHVNAWGLPFAALLAGSSLVMPQSFLQGERLVKVVDEHRITLAGGVPTIWNDFVNFANSSNADLSSLRFVLGGGSAVPIALSDAFERRVGIPITQGWGMTESSPLGAVGIVPAGVSLEETRRYRSLAGRVMPGIEMRVVGGDGEVLENDGHSVGEFEIRGPWVTGSYYLDADPEKFHDGWLRTGDVGSLDVLGFMEITDRTKDVIKSGGEWISSVQLENDLMAHPDVYEAAVIAVPDERWQERPLVVVVRAPGATVDANALHQFLTSRVARWWLPERWTFVEQIPKTSVGKFDKKVLRSRYAAGEFDVEVVGSASR